MKIYNKKVSRLVFFTDILGLGYRCDMQLSKDSSNKDEFCIFFDDKEEIQALQEVTSYYLELYKKEETNA